MTEKNRQKAHALKDLRLLISSDFFYFRAKISFTDTEKTELTAYGHEHSVTYKQCLAGYAKEIHLDATKGYKALVDWITVNGNAGFIKIAKIYGRENITDNFDTTHRVYIRGKWQQITDPIIPADKNNRILDFIVKNGRVEPTGIRENLPDFKAEVTAALNENEKSKQIPADIKKIPVKKVAAKKPVKKTAKKKKEFKQDHSIY